MISPQDRETEGVQNPFLDDNHMPSSIVKQTVFFWSIISFILLKSNL